MRASDFIATLALFTSAISITYTIVVDRRRPKVRVRGQIVDIFDRAPGQTQRHGPFFSVSATNHGPGRVQVMGVAIAKKGWFRKLLLRLLCKTNMQGVILDTLPDSPNRLPMWLEVGESLNLLYPSDGEMILQEEFDRLYLYDSIGGEHWSQKKVFSSARDSLKEGSSDTK